MHIKLKFEAGDLLLQDIFIETSFSTIDDKISSLFMVRASKQLKVGLNMYGGFKVAT